MTTLILTGYTPARVPARRAAELRPALEHFNYEYCAALDGGDIEAWPGFFTEDCLYRVTARENAELGMPVGLVYAEGRAMLHDRAVAIARTQMFAPRHMLHMLSNLRIVAEQDGELATQCNFQLLQTLVEGPTTLHMAGVFHDRLVWSGETLLLKERQVVYDTSIIANDLVYPV